MGIFQIVMFSVQKQLVVDIWESDDRRLLLRCVKMVAGGKAGWDFGEHTFTVHKVDYSDFVPLNPRKWELVIAVPKGCKVPRPCIDGVDFMVWNDGAETHSDHAIDLTEDERKLLINLLSTHTQAYDGPATRLLNKLKDLKGED